MEMYELYANIKTNNPDCVFVGIKTDCLVFKNITNKPATSDKWGDIKIASAPLIKECTLNQPPKLRTEQFKLPHGDWNKITWNTDDGYTKSRFRNG